MIERQEDVERHRGRLLGVAYRMLGSWADAEDVVQEAYLRWHQAETAQVRSSEAWLVTVVTRLSIDRLRRRAAEREHYPGPWLPDPVGEREAWSIDPERRAELASDLSMAFLVILERLGPEERAAFLLREVFGHEYDEIAVILGKSRDACRQIVHRAKDRVRRNRPRFYVSVEVRTRLIERLIAAIAAEDEKTLLTLFAKNATWAADSGGKVRGAGQNVIYGAERITRLVIGLQRKYYHGMTPQIATFNGEPGLLLFSGDQLVNALSIETDGEHILAVYTIINPDKLRYLGATRLSQRPV